MLVTLGHCNTSAMNVSVLHWVFEPAGYRDDAALHLLCAKNYVRNRFDATSQSLVSRAIWRNEKIKVAYLSSDFRLHPLSFLMAELFELHDRFVFCCFNNNWKITPAVFDVWMQQIGNYGPLLRTFCRVYFPLLQRPACKTVGRELQVGISHNGTASNISKLRESSAALLPSLLERMRKS